MGRREAALLPALTQILHFRKLTAKALSRTMNGQNKSEMFKNTRRNRRLTNLHAGFVDRNRRNPYDSTTQSNAARRRHTKGEAHYDFSG